MVTQRLVSNFNTILRAKIYLFLKKSIWKYLILTAIMGYLIPINNTHPFVSALLYFLGVMLILWPLQYFSAKTLGKTINFDALVEFNQDKIIINHTNKDEIETKNWNWIKRIELKKDKIWLTLNLSRPFVISIPKSKLQQSEIDFFKLKQIEIKQ
ncbi:hypothetical protein [uncultured Formosa sp.]|uniref:hypothetical protein n=1 Tax=uncultured Formosa sp. TaxID=255435 RepID=UPI00262CF07C|nr:hypothetical protein [uncultured Formosa sp.]